MKIQTGGSPPQKSKGARLPDTNHRDANGAEGGRYESKAEERQAKAPA
jgi:hypothetical protein